jgi:hypothetical protein
MAPGGRPFAGGPVNGSAFGAIEAEAVREVRGQL